MWIKFIKAGQQSDFRITKNEIHRAAQLVSTFPRSFLPDSEGDEFAAFLWDAKRRLLKTQYFGAMKNVQLGLNILKYQIEVHIEEMIFYTLPLEGKSIKELREWLLDKFQGIQIDTTNYSSVLPYQLDTIEFDVDHVFEAVDNDDLKFLTTLYQNAFTSFQKTIETHNLKKAIIRTWPHHFDMAFTMPVASESTLTIGMSPGDHQFDQPYFFVSQWPKQEDIPVSKLTPIVGRWHLNGWQGLVLAENDFILENEYLQERIILDFIKNAIQLVKKIAV